MSDWEPQPFTHVVSIEVEIDLSRHALARIRIDDVPADDVESVTEWLYRRLMGLEAAEEPKPPRKPRKKIIPINDEGAE